MSYPLVKACLNGNHPPGGHPALPVSPEAIAADARAAGEAGAAAVHFHPRGPDGRETFAAEACGAAIQAVREACPGLPLGLSTGEWIEPHIDRRLELIGAWDPAPDFVSVNLSEEGASRVIEQALGRGVGVEAGLCDLRDVETLLASGLADRCMRVLIETLGEAEEAVGLAAAMSSALSDGGVGAPQLHHGEGIATWAVIDAALAAGHDVRVGLEDTFLLPDGSTAPGNAALVAAAVERSGSI